MAPYLRRVPYIPDHNLYRDYYKGSGLAVFKGNFQDGSGILSNIMRYALPIVKSVGKTVGKSVLRSGADVLRDVISGERDIKTALRQRGLEGLKHVGTELAGKVLGSVKQKGGRRRRRQTKATPRKRKRAEVLDIFDISTKRRNKRACENIF